MKKVGILVILLLLGTLLCACSRNTTEVIAYLDENLTEIEQKAVVASINQIPDIQSTVYVTAEEALAQFLESHKSDDAFAGIEAGDLRDRIVITVSTADQDAIAAQILEIEGVSDVASQMKPSFFVMVGAWVQELLT